MNLVIRPHVPKPSKGIDWAAVTGITIALVLFAIIPLFVTFTTMFTVVYLALVTL